MREAIGTWGERYATRYLQSLGWTILARNWRCQAGEIDVVALDPSGPTTVVVEVKTRTGLGFGDPLEAITYAKLDKLRSLALHWRAANPSLPGLRIDGIGVLSDPTAAPAGQVQLRHVRGLT